MKIKAQKDVLDEHGFKVFTQNHTYDVILDKGEHLAVYCDLKAMYNIPKESLNWFKLIE